MLALDPGDVVAVLIIRIQIVAGDSEIAVGTSDARRVDHRRNSANGRQEGLGPRIGAAWIVGSLYQSAIAEDTNASFVDQIGANHAGQGHAVRSRLGRIRIAG